MKRLILIIALTFAACHAPVTVTTPAGKTAYSADQIVIRVNELQNAAIAAQANGSLPTATTRTIVEFAVAADKTLAATPAGWQTTLTTAWTQAKAKLPAIQNPAIQSAISAVDLVLAVGVN